MVEFCTDIDLECPSTTFGVVTGARASTGFVNRCNFGKLKLPSRLMYGCGSAYSSGTMLYRELTAFDRHLVFHDGYSAARSLLFLLRTGVVCGLSGCLVGQDSCAWNLPMRRYVASNHPRVILTISRRTCNLVVIIATPQLASAATFIRCSASTGDLCRV
jgi:hypothetical protein